jgi:hypothetical protein
MIRVGRMIGVIVALSLTGKVVVADERLASLAPPSLSPVQTEHTFNRDLRPRKKHKKVAPPSVVKAELPADTFALPATTLAPIRWPKDSDIRHRIMTEEVRATPVLGWIAANLWRSKRENGWCLEVDPGDGEYRVLYRKHMK